MPYTGDGFEFTSGREIQFKGRASPLRNGDIACGYEMIASYGLNHNEAMELRATFIDDLNKWCAANEVPGVTDAVHRE